MYDVQATKSDGVPTLQQKLEQDASGALRDMYLDRLQLARDEIAAALAAPNDAAGLAVLRQLAEAVKTSEAVLMEVWNTYHDSRGGAARMANENHRVRTTHFT